MNGESVEIFIKIKVEKKKFSKQDIEFKLYKT